MVNVGDTVEYGGVDTRVLSYPRRRGQFAVVKESRSLEEGVWWCSIQFDDGMTHATTSSFFTVVERSGPW